jgi:predicted nucleic acid-binding protein
VRFWDTSALVPLILPSSRSTRAARLVREDLGITVWWATHTECVSACARLEREGRLTPAGLNAALARLKALASQWVEVPPSNAVREQAARLLRVHPLRAADALQLAAAIVAADHTPTSLAVVTEDARLALAAEREGFTVLSKP